MVDVYIGIGSNVNPHKNVADAINLLKSNFPSVVFSRVFESTAIGFIGDNFLNLVARFSANDIDMSTDSVQDHDMTNQRLISVIKKIKHIEQQMGRTRGSKKYSDRCIDIDVLLFGDLQVNSPIELPRGEILENAYVLWPLSELAPQLIHPKNSKSYQSLWESFDQQSQSLKPVELDYRLIK